MVREFEKGKDGLTALTMIDEPEVSLHPELLSLLADLLREASTRTNILVATHSDRLVRFLNPNEVVVMDIKDDGLATALWADTFDLEEWLTCVCTSRSTALKSGSATGSTTL